MKKLPKFNGDETNFFSSLQCLRQLQARVFIDEVQA